MPVLLLRRKLAALQTCGQGANAHCPRPQCSLSSTWSLVPEHGNVPCKVVGSARRNADGTTVGASIAELYGQSDSQMRTFTIR
jgi:hypothetical protein